MEGWLTIWLPALAGLTLGAVLGVTVQRTDYCAMGAVSDILLMADWQRMRSWLLALAVALGGTQALALLGAIDLATTAYLVPRAGLFGVAAGALLFGFGMTQTGGCISRTLVRAGGGSLKALAVLLVLGLAGAAAMLALAWLPAPGPRPWQSVPDGPLAVPASLLLCGALAFFCLRDRRFRASPLCAAGVILGALVPLGWLATGPLIEGRAQATSVNFVSPAVLGILPFWLALVTGTLSGAYIVARRTGRFRIEGFADAGDLRSNLAGALLMGAGGVLAGGCTIGQGLSGVASLALASWIALAGMIGGALAGIRYLEQGSLKGVVRTLFAGG